LKRSVVALSGKPDSSISYLDKIAQRQSQELIKIIFSKATLRLPELKGSLSANNANFTESFYQNFLPDAAGRSLMD
jgi:hypothetical protein